MLRCVTLLLRQQQPIGHAKTLCGANAISAVELDALVALGAVQTGLPAEFESLPDPPDTFDSATHWPNCKDTITDIRDQSDCGCCWAFAAASAASDRMCIATNGTLKVPLSAQQLCFCGSTNGCMGNTIVAPWQFILSKGLVTGGQFNNTGPLQPTTGASPWCSDFSLPHCHHHGPQRDDPFPDDGTAGCPKVTVSPKCPTSCDADTTRTMATDVYVGTDGSPTGLGGMGAEKQVRQAIWQNGPVEATFTVYEVGS